MSTDKQQAQIGKDPAQIDTEQPDEKDVADALGFESVGGRDGAREDQDIDEMRELVDDIADPATRELLDLVLDDLADERKRRRDLEDVVQDQQETIEEQQETIQDLTARHNEFQQRVDDVEESEEKTRDIARSAVAKAEQAAADPDQQEDAEQLPQGVEPSTSPLDFFANCRQSKIKEMYVENNKDNTYRAIVVWKRWREFATKRSDGSGIFFTRDNVENALTAILGKSPHRETIRRVWEKMQEVGGRDVEMKSRQVGRRQQRKQILCMARETAEGLLEKRYIGMDLLEDGETKALTGGVTPVVTGASG
ncbi:hypothetical protein ACFR9U_16220 [Halorientalis brevis]|uniref:Uncharacterized protein n=1 Tax=Halorientalis brevis TaxID=1126241 RepID=A0ABD6CE37_9EURY|nr:hypothetical protein [Halorientalis brevis]